VGSGRCGSGNPPKPNTCWDARTRSKVRSQHRAQLPHVFTTHMNHPDDVGRVRVTAERKEKGSRARAGQMAEAVYFKHFSQSTQRRSRAKSRARAARASPTSTGGSLAARGLPLEVWARTGRARAPQVWC
jgi:LmbE family N-acetylglucosaminyl deacetylase